MLKQLLECDLKKRQLSGCYTENIRNLQQLTIDKTSNKSVIIVNRKQYETLV